MPLQEDCSQPQEFDSDEGNGYPPFGLETVNYILLPIPGAGYRTGVTQEASQAFSEYHRKIRRLSDVR